jgi:hypothetical protein
VSDTSITAVTPARAAGTVDVLVTTPGGTSVNTAADNFTFTAATITYTLTFRWSLIVWLGQDGVSASTALGAIANQVTSIWRWNATAQQFEGFFPGSENVPGANDFTTLTRLTAYWISIVGPGSVTWTVTAG